MHTWKHFQLLCEFLQHWGRVALSLCSLLYLLSQYIQKWDVQDLKHPNLLQLYSIYLEGSFFVVVFLLKEKKKFSMMLFSSSILFTGTLIVGLSEKRADFQIAAQEP